MKAIVLTENKYIFLVLGLLILGFCGGFIADKFSQILGTIAFPSIVAYLFIDDLTKEIEIK